MCFPWTSAETWKCFITAVVWLHCFCSVSAAFPSLSSLFFHLLPSQMQQRCYFAFSFLCSLLFPSLARSLQCAETQYVWEIGKQKLCCDMCQPGKATCSKKPFCITVWKAKCGLMGAFLGHYLSRRCSKDSSTQCKPCDRGRYINTYNVEWACDFCENCNNCEYFQLLLDS